MTNRPASREGPRRRQRPGEHPGRVLALVVPALIEVAYGSPGDDDPGGSGHALEDSHRGQHSQRRRRRRGRRGRQAYRTTDAGRAALEEWLVAPGQHPQVLRDEIAVKLALLGSSADGRLEEMLDLQRQAYLQQLRDLADQERLARERGRPELALLFRGAQLHAEADLKWLDACAEELGRRS